MAGKRIVASGRVENDEVSALPELGRLFFQSFDRVADEYPERGAGKFDAAPLLGFDPVFEVAIEGALTRIEIERSDFRALVGEGHGDVHRGRRFSGATLFIEIGRASCRERM